MREKLEQTLTDVKCLNIDEYTIVIFGAGNTSVLYAHL
jgi:hypothetical protein